MPPHWPAGDETSTGLAATAGEEPRTRPSLGGARPRPPGPPKPVRSSGREPTAWMTRSAPRRLPHTQEGQSGRVPGLEQHPLDAGCRHTACVTLTPPPDAPGAQGALASLPRRAPRPLKRGRFWHREALSAVLSPLGHVSRRSLARIALGPPRLGSWQSRWAVRKPWCRGVKGWAATGGLQLTPRDGVTLLARCLLCGSELPSRGPVSSHHLRRPRPTPALRTAPVPDPRAGRPTREPGRSALPVQHAGAPGTVQDSLLVSKPFSSLLRRPRSPTR